MDISKVQMINDNVLFFFSGGHLQDTIKIKGGLELYKDTSFEPTFSIKDKAVVVSCGNKSKVPLASVVWINYLVTHQDKSPLHKEDSGAYFRGKDEDVFLWEKDDKIQTMNQWVIVEPEKIEVETVSSSGIISFNHKEKGNEKKGTIRFLNPDITEKLGLKVGDLVLLDKNAHYAFKFKGQELYRVDSNYSILGTENE